MGKLFLLTVSEYVSFDSSMLESVLQGAKDNIAVILPIAIGLFTIVIGLELIPMIVKRFMYGNESFFFTKDMDDWTDSEWDIYYSHSESYWDEK